MHRSRSPEMSPALLRKQSSELLAHARQLREEAEMARARAARRREESEKAIASLREKRRLAETALARHRSRDARIAVGPPMGFFAGVKTVHQ